MQKINSEIFKLDREKDTSRFYENEIIDNSSGDINKINWFRLFHFYSTWGLISHVLYYLNIIGNTFPIAIFILVVSQFFLFIYPGYIHIMQINWIYEFIFHYIPIILIKPNFSNMKYLYISALIYAILFNFKIIEIYKDPLKYINH